MGIATAAAMTLLFSAACSSPADKPADGDAIEMEIVAFSPPSLGAFLPAVIAEKRFDLENGLDITFVERPPAAYNTEFSTGQFKVGGSGSLMSEAVRLSQGVDVVYLFNVHDYWGGLVSTTPEVTELADLEGRTLAASTSVTNYALFLWFVQAAGVDIEKVTVENHDTGGLGTQAQTGRSDAVQIWEPGYSNLMAQNLEHVKDVPLPFHLWKEEYGTDDIPFLGVAVHRDWLEANEEAAKLLQTTYEKAAEWTLANPAEAAQIIADSMDGGNVEALTELISNNDRLGLNVRSAAEIEEGIAAVFDAGVAIKYFDEAPPLTLIPGK